MQVRIPVPDVRAYDVIVEPPRPEEGCWAGAPCVLGEPDGSVWLAYRLREPEARGYELRIARSHDGLTFETVDTVRADDIGVISVERAALTRHPSTGQRELYLSYDAGGWRIARAERPEGRWRLEPLDALLTPPGVTGVKDPYVLEYGGERYMLYTAYVDLRERLFVAVERDNGSWTPLSDQPLLTNEGWHRLFARPSCAFAVEGGVAVLYEGCSGEEYSPIYNIRGGMAFSRDLRQTVDLTPEGPLLQTPTPGRFATLRYVAALEASDGLRFYYEAARPDGAFELRRSAGMHVEFGVPYDTG